MKRRSIVQFEDWLDEEIATVKANLGFLVLESEVLARKHATEEIRLETLEKVKAKLAPVHEADALVAEDADAEAVRQ